MPPARRDPPRALTVRVSVAWATPDVQDVVPVDLPAGATVGAAIAASGLLDRYGVARDSVRPGIRGRLVRDDAVPEDGDRIDLCRPLAVDPKEARRLRAAARARATAPPREGGEPPA
jgi:uncharacterized protein